jgi:hypothetical protein
MSESLKTFRDPLLSLYQSAVADVARKIDEERKPGLVDGQPCADLWRAPFPI